MNSQGRKRAEAATLGTSRDVSIVAAVREFEAGYYRFLESERPKVLTELAASKALSDEIANALTEAVDEFRKSFLA